MWWLKRIDKIKNLPPEVIEVTQKYGVWEGSLPPYVIVGIDKFIGVICFAGNEFHANLIKKIIVDSGGQVILGQTETHPSECTYAIEGTRELMSNIDNMVEDIRKQ